MELRPTGLRQHSHACWSYDTDSERATVLGGYFAEGLAARERLFYFGDGNTGGGAALKVGLEMLGLDVEALVHAGDLVIGDAEQAYFPAGRFDATANLDGFRALARQAVTDGRTGIRVAAENAAILNHAQIRDRWFDYELQVDALVAQEPIVGLCSFDRRVCDEETLRLLDAVHLVQHDPSGSAPHSPFHLHSVEADVLVLTGDVDGLGANAFQRLLSESARGRERLRLDLRGLSFLAPAGMLAIEELAHQRPTTYAPLELQGVTPFQAKVWSLLKRISTERSPSAGGAP